MAYKLRVLHEDGKPFTDQEMRDYFRENPLTIPSMTANPVKPTYPVHPKGMSNRQFQEEIWLPFYATKWIPYERELMAQDNMINELAADLASRFAVCTVVARTGEIRPKAPQWGVYINFARVLTGYYTETLKIPRPEHPMEWIVKGTY